MNWPFIAVFLSGWLYVDAAYRGPNWQRWIFRPLTLILLLLLTWSESLTLDITGYLICAGLLVAIISDALNMFSSERLDLALYTKCISFLLYAVSFALHGNFSFYLPLPAVLIIIVAVVLVLIWRRLDEQKVPVLSALLCALIMSWIAGEQFFALGNDYNFSLMLGAFLLFISYALWLINRFTFSFKAAKAIYSCCYFLGHFLIVRSLVTL